MQFLYLMYPFFLQKPGDHSVLPWGIRLHAFWTHTSRDEIIQQRMPDKLWLVNSELISTIKHDHAGSFASVRPSDTDPFAGRLLLSTPQGNVEALWEVYLAPHPQCLHHPMLWSFLLPAGQLKTQALWLGLGGRADPTHWGSQGRKTLWRTSHTWARGTWWTPTQVKTYWRLNRELCLYAFDEKQYWVFMFILCYRLLLAFYIHVAWSLLEKGLSWFHINWCPRVIQIV